MQLFIYAALVAGLFLIVRGGFDVRGRRYGWGAAGIVIGVVLLSAPVETNAVKVDLPRAMGR